MITGGTLTGLLQLQQEEKDNHQVLKVHIGPSNMPVRTGAQAVAINLQGGIFLSKTRIFKA